MITYYFKLQVCTPYPAGLKEEKEECNPGNKPGHMIFTWYPMYHQRESEVATYCSYKPTAIHLR